MIRVHCQTGRNSCKTSEYSRSSIHGPRLFLSWNMFKTTCRNGLKRLRIACTACVLWIDVTNDGSWLCICKGGSTIGIVLKIRCKTKCDKTLRAGKVYIENSENNILAQVNIKDSISANKQSTVKTLQVKKDSNTCVWRCRCIRECRNNSPMHILHVAEASCSTNSHQSICSKHTWKRQQTVNDSWS